MKKREDERVEKQAINLQSAYVQELRNFVREECGSCISDELTIIGPRVKRWAARSILPATDCIISLSLTS